MSGHVPEHSAGWYVIWLGAIVGEITWIQTVSEDNGDIDRLHHCNRHCLQQHHHSSTQLADHVAPNVRGGSCQHLKGWSDNLLCRNLLAGDSAEKVGAAFLLPHNRVCRDSHCYGSLKKLTHVVRHLHGCQESFHVGHGEVLLGLHDERLRRAGHRNCPFVIPSSDNQLIKSRRHVHESLRQATPRPQELPSQLLPVLRVLGILPVDLQVRQGVSALRQLLERESYELILQLCWPFIRPHAGLHQEGRPEGEALKRGLDGDGATGGWLFCEKLWGDDRSHHAVAQDIL
mmetsp:Transcript_1956/g.4681  ORF Transcript_1956/g.4681 Transcript_1956/m.4681 type:complete len:288 (+) Transcript_1956:1572-2435(+)